MSKGVKTGERRSTRERCRAGNRWRSGEGAKQEERVTYVEERERDGSDGSVELQEGPGQKHTTANETEHLFFCRGETV